MGFCSGRRRSGRVLEGRKNDRSWGLEIEKGIEITGRSLGRRLVIIWVFHGAALVRRDAIEETIVSLVETQRLRCGHGSRRRGEREMSVSGE